MLFWSLGSVGGATWSDLPLLGVVVLVGVGVLAVNGQRLNALSASADLTASLGINVARFQTMLMLTVALLTGCMVAVVGGIGFVGLVVPHIARLLVGADHRRVLISSALLGAVFLPSADIAARLLRAPAELPIGIITAAVGAPFFLWLLIRSSGRRGLPSRLSSGLSGRLSRRLPQRPRPAAGRAAPDTDPAPPTPQLRTVAAAKEPAGDPDRRETA